MSRTALRLQVLPRALMQLLGKPWRRRPQQVSRILIAHHLLLGDTLMLTPLLAALRQCYPQAEILMLCPKAIAPLYQGRPYDVSVLPWHPADAKSLLPLWQAPGFDLAFVPGDNRYSWLALAAGARWIVAHGHDRPAWKNWPLDEVHDYPAHADGWHGMVAKLANKDFRGRYQPPDWPAPTVSHFTAPPQPYAVLHVGASSPLKFWPAERWLALADWLQRQGIVPCWSGGPGEEALVSAIDPTGRYVSLAGQLSLAAMWHLLQHARLLVCPDTGVAHLGRLVNVPTVVLFGPGSDVLCGAGDFWRDAPFRSVTIRDMPCRDQRVMFRREAAWIRRCGRSVRECTEPRCMSLIMLDPVYKACADLLASNSLLMQDSE